MLPTRDLADGRQLFIYQMMYTARLCLGLPNAVCYDDMWCYHTVADAARAMETFDPATMKEPDGWHRHPPSGRRRPDGDATKEYVNL